MPRLPPGLCGIVASIIADCARECTSRSLALKPSIWSPYLLQGHIAWPSSNVRHYATARPDEYDKLWSQHGKEHLQPKLGPSISPERPRDSSQTVARTVEGLDTDRRQIDDVVYDQTETDFLTKALQQTARRHRNRAVRSILLGLVAKACGRPDPLNALRRLAIATLPPTIRSKAAVRLPYSEEEREPASSESAVGESRHWTDLCRLIHSTSLNHRQKVEAKELFDVMWRTAHKGGSNKRASLKLIVSDILSDHEPRDILRRMRRKALTYGNLPNVLRDKITTSSSSTGQETLFREPVEDEAEPEQQASVLARGGNSLANEQPKHQKPPLYSRTIGATSNLKETYGPAKLACRQQAHLSTTQLPLRLFDQECIRASCSMPSEEQYPQAPSHLWDPGKVQSQIHNVCKSRSLALASEVEYLEKSMDPRLHPHGTGRFYTCKLNVEIKDVCQESCHGDGYRQMDARRAAWSHLLSKMHVSGALAELLSPFSVPKPLHLRDVEHVLSTCVQPSKEQYPHALPELWQAKRESVTIRNGCAQQKLSLEVDTDFIIQRLTGKQVRKLSDGATIQQYHCCTLKVHIENLFQETTYGEGPSKQEAARAAWLEVVSQMHVNGVLASLFPGTNVDKKDISQTMAESAKSEKVTEEAFEEDFTKPEKIDTRTLEDEKDAKTEIYNWAAGHGFVPQFETSMVQPRIRRVRLGRSPKSIVQVNIKVDELSIDVTATGQDLQTAEVAAALAFKRTAERCQLNAEGGQLQNHFAVLEAETAKYFLDFCKEKGVNLNLEMEVQSVLHGSKTCHQAMLTADGKQIGQVVIMPAKQKARALAHLTGALDIAKNHPHLLPEFTEALKKGNGKLLMTVDPVELALEPETSQIMRNALIEAHAAGLPNAQETLGAESRDTDGEVSRRWHSLGKAGIARARYRLMRDQRTFDLDPALEELRKKKDSLPVRGYVSELLAMIKGHAYSIVIGTTGSGKTTQVPQILFEHAIRQGDGAHCNIICTQPRRIAATSVARRVAEERNEVLRKTVGHHVRFDSKPPYHPYGLTYCTTGILLEKLKYDPDGVLDAVSHIVIDEVHERDLLVDFLMIILKKATQIRQAGGKKVPKVVLMSATLDTDLFASYFKQLDAGNNTISAPCLDVPGRAFPVHEMYLGSIMQDMFDKHHAKARQLIAADTKSEEFLRIETDFSAKSSGQEEPRRDSVIDWKRERSFLSDCEEESSAKSEREEALVPIGLIVTTIAHICATTSADGAILVFLPGLKEILETQDTLLGSRIFDLDFTDSSKFRICLLHSTLPKEQQSEIFEPSPAGCRKIVLSTNIAETSVTVTDVKFVVDSGKLRETRYDQLRRITKLQCVWQGKTNSRQRMGRAGRVQEGFYYAVFSKERADSMRAVGLPELLRSDLQEICLSVKAQKFDEPAASFLAQAIEPPPKAAVDAAVNNLKAIQAYTAAEELTALGRVLSKLPVHPALGKMIILGIIFMCLDPMIFLGAAAEGRSIFQQPIGSRADARRAHGTYAGKAQSDHVAQFAAFKELRQLAHDQGSSAARSRGQEKYLHFGAFRGIDQTGQQIIQILIKSGLIPDDFEQRGTQYGPDNLNTNAGNNDLIKCLLLAGSHPNLAIKLSSKGESYRTPRESHVLMHPSSLNKERRSKSDQLLHPRSTLFAYSSLSRNNDGTNLFIRSCTRVTPLMVALFGGHLRIPTEGIIEMDHWLPFAVEGHEKEFTTKLILEFRKALERVLQKAYASLADLNDGDGEDGEDRVGGLVDDPVREKFAQRVVEVLKGGEGGQDGAVAQWWATS